MDAYDGEAFELVQNRSGNVLQIDPKGAPTQNQIALSTKMPDGNLTAALRRNDWAVAQTGRLTPGETTLFTLDATLFAAVAEGKIGKGDPLDADSFVAEPTQLSLLGVTSATIAWIDTGSTAEPFAFELTDIQSP